MYIYIYISWKGLASFAIASTRSPQKFSDIDVYTSTGGQAVMFSFFCFPRGLKRYTTMDENTDLPGVIESMLRNSIFRRSCSITKERPKKDRPPKRVPSLCHGDAFLFTVTQSVPVLFYVDSHLRSAKNVKNLRWRQAWAHKSFDHRCVSILIFYMGHTRGITNHSGCSHSLAELFFNVFLLTKLQCRISLKLRSRWETPGESRIYVFVSWRLLWTSYY